MTLKSKFQVSNLEVFLPKCKVLLLNTTQRKDVPVNFCLIVGHKMSLKSPHGEMTITFVFVFVCWLHIVTIVLLVAGDLEAGLFSVDMGNIVCGLLHMAFSDN